MSNTNNPTVTFLLSAKDKVEYNLNTPFGGAVVPIPTDCPELLRLSFVRALTNTTAIPFNNIDWCNFPAQVICATNTRHEPSITLAVLNRPQLFFTWVSNYTRATDTYLATFRLNNLSWQGILDAYYQLLNIHNSKFLVISKTNSSKCTTNQPEKSEMEVIIFELNKMKNDSLNCAYVLNPEKARKLDEYWSQVISSLSQSSLYALAQMALAKEYAFKHFNTNSNESLATNMISNYCLENEAKCNS